MIREKAVAFGPDRSLVGVLTQASTPGSHRPCVVFLNSGIIHRVGVSRLHVTLARAFADVGFTTLRFDLSGVGDSAPCNEPLSLPEIVAKDIDDALAFLGKHHHAESFILVGLCSGAHDAFAAAARRPDVVGLALLDLPGPFRNWQHYVYHFGRRLLRSESWLNTFTGRNEILVRLFESLRARKVADPVTTAEDRPEQAKAVMKDQFSRLLARQIPVALVFTGMEDAYNHHSQFGEVFPSIAAHPLIVYDFLQEADHLFTQEEQQKRLRDLLIKWIISAPYPDRPAET